MLSLSGHHTVHLQWLVFEDYVQSSHYQEHGYCMILSKCLKIKAFITKHKENLEDGCNVLTLWESKILRNEKQMKYANIT